MCTLIGTIANPNMSTAPASFIMKILESVCVISPCVPYTELCKLATICRSMLQRNAYRDGDDEKSEVTTNLSIINILTNTIRRMLESAPYFLEAIRHSTLLDVLTEAVQYESSVVLEDMIGIITAISRACMLSLPNRIAVKSSGAMFALYQLLITTPELRPALYNCLKLFTDLDNISELLSALQHSKNDSNLQVSAVLVMIMMPGMTRFRRI